MVVVMERKDSRLRLIGASLDESERSMKKDLDSGEEANGSTATYELIVLSARDSRMAPWNVTHSPFGADGVEGLPVEIQESLAWLSVFEFLSTLRNRLLLLGFLDAIVALVVANNTFSSPVVKGLRSNSLDEKEAMDMRLSAAGCDDVLETSIDIALL